MAVHLLIVDALNLIRRIHAVQGTPCKDTCLHALEQLIRHSEPTHAVAVLMTKPAIRAGGTSVCPTTKPDAHRCRTIFTPNYPCCAPHLNSGASCWGAQGNEADDLAATPP